ncbi:MAG: hypothetical protein AB7I04_18320 [Pseudomonadales bacterium]
MARVKDGETGKRVTAKLDPAKVADQAAAVLGAGKPEAETVPAKGENSQRTLEFCATCSHSKAEDHPDGPCIAEWEQDKQMRRCSCSEYWPVRRQREEGWAVTGWNLRFSAGVPVMHKRRIESELWNSLRSGGSVRLEIVAVVGPRGFKAVKDHGVQIAVEEIRTLEVVRLLYMDPETGERDA